MTIKPLLSAPPSKRTANDVDGNKEAHGVVPVGVGQVVVEQSVVVGQAHRNVSIDGHGHGQSPQRRGEVYDELTRSHRCSPHKSTRSKRRDHHDHHHHHKRERVEREKHVTHNNAGVGGTAQAAVTASGVNSSNNSVANANVGGKSPEQLVHGSQPSAKVPAQTPSGIAKAIEESYSGYNSGDEHLQPKEGAITVEEWQRRDEEFAKSMTERGYDLKPVEEDGACLFRSISLQIYGDEEMHDVIRQHTMDYINKNREYYSQFVTEDINGYIKRKRRKDSHGNHIEIQAISEIYSRPVEVYCYETTPINIFDSEHSKNGYPPLRLSYQRGSHYNAIIDPYNATVGVGLGLAGYKPEFQTKEAVRLSEQHEIEQTMFEDKLKTTDWEATNEAIEEQIARESYLQWCRENLQRSRATAAAASSTSSTITSSEAARSDSEASPSKYSQLLQLSGSGSSSTSVSTGSACVSLNSSAAGLNSSVSPKNNLFEHALAQLSSKSISQLAHNLKKDDQMGYESDATDMSSTSSAGQYGGMSPSTASVQRATKAKSRRGALRGNKKRRHEHDMANPSSTDLKTEPLEVPTRKSPKRDSCLDAPFRSMTPEAEQQPCTSKQSSTPEKNANTKTPLGSVNASSKLTSPNQAYSNFYQELLEASYAATDGFSESEMLQRAIQMSTQDYFEDQKRKYFYGP